MSGEPYVTADTLDDRASAWIEDLSPYMRHPGVGDLEGAALLVVDMQGYFLKPESHAFIPAALPIVSRLDSLARSFRSAGRPVYFTRHAHRPGDRCRAMSAWWNDLIKEGDPLALLDPRIEVGPLDLVLTKQTYSAFDGTALTTLLEERGCDTLVIGGVMTHLCVSTSAREAFIRDLHVEVLLDATAAPDEALHLSALRTLAHGVARVVTTADVARSLPSGG